MKKRGIIPTIKSQKRFRQNKPRYIINHIPGQKRPRPMALIIQALLIRPPGRPLFRRIYGTLSTYPRQNSPKLLLISHSFYSIRFHFIFAIPPAGAINYRIR